MAERSAGTRLGAILWFVAALLAWSAVAIGYLRRDEVRWSLAAAGLFFLIMGLSALKRARDADAARTR
jgi:hypothetical protein